MNKINRKLLVKKHNIIIRKPCFRSPLSLGNGKFGFAVDITGMQTFSDEYRYEQPLCILSEWGWHSFPKPEYLKGKKLKLKEYISSGRAVKYPTDEREQSALFNYLRANPHRIPLAKFGFSFIEKVSIEDFKDIYQEHDLYTGIVNSNFTLFGEKVSVTTCAMFECDAIGVKIKSSLLEYERLRVKFEFPYASTWLEREAYAASSRCDKGNCNKVDIIDEKDGFVKIKRSMDDAEYYVGINYENSSMVYEENFVEIASFFGDEISFVIQFSKNENMLKNYSFGDAAASSEKALESFWENGGIINFENCEDERAKKLEDRMIKSMYITRTQSCSSLPPQESGFLGNSWYGKSHLEMHYWHSAHFALWNRTDFLENSIQCYLDFSDKSAAIAKRQGYEGIRFPKMIDNEFSESPSSIAPLLIWQQPHIVMFAELIYRNKKSKTVLEKYFNIVENSCKFMLDFLSYDGLKDEYCLNAPYIPAQEHHNPEDVKNAVFELEYWHFALSVYKKWCQRLNRTPISELDEKLLKLSKPPVIDNLYPAHENCPDTFESFNLDHPSMLCVYGVLPGWRIDEKIVRNTLHKVLKCWKWETTWGWDYALLSMCAAKLGERELAVDILLKETAKNEYGINGHVYQYPGLASYIPTNASLLLALGFLAAGCDGNEGNKFPENWKVEVEEITQYI